MLQQEKAGNSPVFSMPLFAPQQQSRPATDLRLAGPSCSMPQHEGERSTLGYTAEVPPSLPSNQWLDHLCIAMFSVNDHDAACMHDVSWSNKLSMC